MWRLLPVLLLAWLACCGCVWGPGPGEDAFHPREKRTVRLNTIENRTFPHRPGLEYELTDRLKDEIATDRRLVLSESAADVLLKVSLIRFSEPTIVEDLKTGDPAEILLRATAEIEATSDAYIGGKRKRKVNVSTSYAPGLGGDSRRAGLDRLWRDLAREIVEIAADDWSNS
ncbi:MAG: hypothetical protein KDB90_01020 [Planctomycetes bacterium]|nr:hypothetical protein [Planctomycetota bacterium]